MKVSVAIVSYNYKNYLQECLESILKQEVDFDFEIVVADDASTDGTVQMLLDYKNKIGEKLKLVLHEKNGGLIKNYSSLYEKCTGEYIAHLDGDDRAYPLRLQKQKEFLDNNSNCFMVAHSMRVFDDTTNKTLYISHNKLNKTKCTINDLVKHGMFFSHSSKMFRKSSIPPEGFDQNSLLSSVIDFTWTLQGAKYGNIGFIDEILGEYRVHNKGAVFQNRIDIDRTIASQLYTLDKAQEMGVDIQDVNFGRAYFWYGYALSSILTNQPEKFLTGIQKSYENNIFINNKHRLLYFMRNNNKVLSQLLRWYSQKKFGIPKY